MISYQRVYNLNGELVVIISAEEIEALGIKDGDEIAISFERIDAATISDEVRLAFEESLERSDEAYRYLSGR